MSSSTEKAAADTADQNKEAATSTAPLDATAKPKKAKKATEADAKDAAESDTQGTNEGNGEAAAGSVAANSETLEAAGDTKPASEQALQDAVEKGSMAYPAGDAQPEREMLAAMRGFMAAFKVRYAEALTGMANSTAEVLRCMAEAETHLADHIAQQPVIGK